MLNFVALENGLERVSLRNFVNECYILYTLVIFYTLIKFHSLIAFTS